VFRTEDCLEKATECDEIARAEDQEELKIYYRALAEHWRTLADRRAEGSASLPVLDRSLVLFAAQVAKTGG
jgi:hypothetical protein